MTSNCIMYACDFNYLTSQIRGKPHEINALLLFLLYTSENMGVFKRFFGSKPFKFSCYRKPKNASNTPKINGNTDKKRKKFIWLCPCLKMYTNANKFSRKPPKTNPPPNLFLTTPLHAFRDLVRCARKR